MYGKSILREKSFAFGLNIIEVCRHLKESKKEYVLYRQMLRSGTAIGALIREAEYAQSKADFEDIHLGKKRLSDLNFFLVSFALMMKVMKKKDRREVKHILKEIETWNISDEILDETGYVESEEEIKCLESLSDLSETNPKDAIKPNFQIMFWQLVIT